MATLTVLTDTYNRAYCLHRCYESLKRQSSKDFVWLIIDDGSTDNTKDLVNNWISDGIVPIQYFWQENRGMHVARNTGFEKSNTELSVWIDSDDYAADDAVERIVSFWRKYGSNEVSGIIALNAWEGGAIIGDRLPKGVSRTTMIEVYWKYKIKGEKKVILRSELARQHPLPVFNYEKFFPESYRFLFLDQEFKMLLMDEIVSFVVPSLDSMSILKNKIKQYYTCPRGFSFFRSFLMTLPISNIRKYRYAIHYTATSMIAKNMNFIRESPRPFLTLTALPFGLLWYFFIRLCNLEKVDFFRRMLRFASFFIKGVRKY